MGVIRHEHARGDGRRRAPPPRARPSAAHPRASPPPRRRRSPRATGEGEGEGEGEEEEELLDLADEETVLSGDKHFERYLRRSETLVATGDEAQLREAEVHGGGARMPLALESDDLAGGRRPQSFARSIFDEDGPVSTAALDDLGDNFEDPAAAAAAKRKRQLEASRRAADGPPQHTSGGATQPDDAGNEHGANKEPGVLTAFSNLSADF